MVRGDFVAIESVFTLSKNKNYSFTNYDGSTAINVRTCVGCFCSVMDSAPTCQVSFHAHPVYEMHFVKDGECEFETSGGNKYKLTKNQFIIIPYQRKHRIVYESEIFSKLITEFEVVHLSENKNDFYAMFEHRIFDMKVYDATTEIVNMVEQLIKNSTEKGNEYKSLISSYLYCYIIETARLVVGNSEIKKKVEYDDQRVSDAINYINANITKGISANEVSGKCFISTRQLVRIFQKNLGTTPSEYIRRCKVDYACRLLLETDIQISEIAEQLGFTEVTAFINFFRRYEDITPAKFRKRNR